MTVDMKGSLVASPSTSRTTEYRVSRRDGTLVAIHVRTDGPAGKDMKWRRASGQWGLNGLATADLPLYGIERLSDDPSEVVVVTEGEKAAEALLRRGIPAVGTVTGASAIPSPEVLSDLTGLHIRLWADNDDVGRKHMSRIAAALDGIAASIGLVNWPDAPPGGDAADYTGDPWDLIGAARLVSGPLTEPLTPDQTAMVRLIESIRLIDALGARLLSEVPDDPPSPLLLGRLDPEGQTVLYGPGGVGKGVLASSWIVGLMAAGYRVAILDYENHPGEWSRRISGLGGTEVRERVLYAAPLSADWRGKRGPIWQQADDLRRLLTAWGATVVIVDSIVVACAADPMKPEAAAQYAAAVEYLGVPVLSLAHVTKADDMRYPFGSVFWHNLARVTWSLERGGEAADLIPRKANNYARPPRFTVEMTWRDGLLREVWERPYQAALADRIAPILEPGPLTVAEIVTALNEAAENGVKADSVRKTLRRGPDRFVQEGDRWRLA